MAPLTRLVITVYGVSLPQDRIISMTPPTRLWESSSSSTFTDLLPSIVQHSAPDLKPSPLSLPDFIAISIAVCLTFVVIVSIADGFGRVRGYHLILQAGEVPAVFNGYRGISDSCLETASPVTPCVNVGIGV